MSFFDRFKDIPIDDDDDSNGTHRAESPVEGPTSDPVPANRIDFGDTGSNINVAAAGHTASAPQKRRGCGRWLLFFLILAIICAVAFYLRYLNPYVTDAREKVYVERVDRRGIFFKTFEVEVLMPRLMADTTATYSRPNNFSVASDSIALKLQQLQNTGQLVEITYETFYASLPWRGASRSVITDVK